MVTRTCTMLRQSLAAAALGLGLCACSSGGAAPPTIDLTGYWLFYMTPSGGSEVGPSPVCLTQTGAAVDGAAIAGTVSGNTFNVVSTAGGLFTITLQGALVGSEATGTMAISGIINLIGTFRLVSFAPSGTMTASGTVQGVAVDMSTTAAIGEREYLDQGLTQLTEVDIVAAYGSEHLEIAFSPTGLTTGALAVPTTITATVSYRNDTYVLEASATSGTVTVTTYDGSGFAGTFSLTLPSGGSLTGTFDVAWDIAAYSP